MLIILTVLLLKLFNNKLNVATLTKCGKFSITELNVMYNTVEIIGADAKTFTCVGEDFGKDRTSVYFEENKIQYADPATFKILNFGFSIDTHYVFMPNFYIPNGSKIIHQVDPTSFIPFSEYISKDCCHVYIINEYGELIVRDDVDAATFTKLGLYYFADKTHLYDLSLNEIAALDTLKVSANDLLYGE